MAFAVENIIRYGDTDIFPYPIERQIFKDKKNEIISMLEDINGSFDELIGKMPLEYEKLLNTVGYSGFRQGTQIDPIWNAYLLGLVTFVGNDIEKARISSITKMFSHIDSNQMRKTIQFLIKIMDGWPSKSMRSSKLINSNLY